MSSVSGIEAPQSKTKQMYGTEEIRFKAGDAWCSILDRDHDVGPVRTRARHWSAPTAGTHARASLGRPEHKVSFLWWRWSCCHESEPGIARCLTDVPMHLA
jgi:hypothetical protein